MLPVNTSIKVQQNKSFAVFYRESFEGDSHYPQTLEIPPKDFSANLRKNLTRVL